MTRDLGHANNEIVLISGAETSVKVFFGTLHPRLITEVICMTECGVLCVQITSVIAYPRDQDPPSTNVWARV